MVTVILGHDARVIPCIFLKIMVHLSYVSGGLACGRRKQRIPASIHLLASAVNCIVKLVLLKNSKFSLYINLQKNKIFRIRYFWSHHLCHQLCPHLLQFLSVLNRLCPNQIIREIVIHWHHLHPHLARHHLMFFHYMMSRNQIHIKRSKLMRHMIISHKGAQSVEVICQREF